VAKTTANLSMPFCGYCEQVRRGVICRLIMVVGKTLIDGFAAGGIKGFARGYLSNWYKNRI
jgi:hypothetical protein